MRLHGSPAPTPEITMKLLAHTTTLTVPVVQLSNVCVSAYRDVIVIWTAYADCRVFDVVDALPCLLREQLAAITLHNGAISLHWAGITPDGYAPGGTIKLENGDCWNITDRDSADPA